MGLQIRDLGRRDVLNIPAPRRPPDADANNLPNTWINVYEQVDAAGFKPANTTSRH